MQKWGFSGGSDSKESTCNAGNPGSIPGLGRFPEGNGNPLQYSFLENPIDLGAWGVTVHGVAKSDMSEPLTLTIHFHFQAYYLYVQPNKIHFQGHTDVKKIHIDT